MSESENIVHTDPTPSVATPDPLVPNLASESVRNFIPPKKKFPLILYISLILLSIVSVISIYLFLQVRQLTLEKLTPSPTPTPLASADPTTDWQTITNSGLLYTIKLPKNWKTITHPSSIAATYESYESSSGQRIDIVKDKNPRTICRGDCPGVESSTPSSVGPYPATKDSGYIGEIGGDIAHRFITFNIPNGSTSLNITFHPSTEERYPGGDIIPITTDEEALFDQILSTFKFTGDTATAPSECIPRNEGYSEICREKQSKSACLELDQYNAKTKKLNNPDGISDCEWKAPVTNGPSSYTATYTCPANGWQDCMPILSEEGKRACSEEAMTWYKANCPDFQGAAL